MYIHVHLHVAFAKQCERLIETSPCRCVLAEYQSDASLNYKLLPCYETFTHTGPDTRVLALNQVSHTGPDTRVLALNQVRQLA